MIANLLKTAAVSTATCVALYLGARAFGSDQRWWMRASWLVYALCIEGICGLVWMLLVVAGANPVQATSIWFAFLVVVLGVPPIVTLSIAATQNERRRLAEAAHAVHPSES